MLRGLPVLLLLAVSHGVILSALNKLAFVNEGVTNSSERFVWRPISPTTGELLYLEAYNVTSIAGGGCANGGWSLNNPFPYLLGANSTQEPGCSFTGHIHEDRPGNDYKQIQFPAGTNESACAAACCADLGTCVAYVFVPQAPSQLEQCSAGHACCWLKNVVPAVHECPSFITSGCYSSVVKQTPTYVPSSGMRSAVPLGGVSTGSFELRGDGSMHEWTIMNQSPGGAAKIQEYDNMFFGINIAGQSAVYQTHPRNGLPGVNALKYSGSYPVSKLSLVDDRFVDQIDLFGFSTYKVGNLAKSARPAVAFVLAVQNVHMHAINATFMFNLGFNVEVDQIRQGTVISTTTASNAVACNQQCNGASTCVQWSYTVASQSCLLMSTLGSNKYQAGVTSGLKATWSVDEDGQCLVMNRAGDGPASGTLSLCATIDRALAPTWSFGSSDDPTAMFGNMAANRPLGSSLSGTYGAAAISAILGPGMDGALVLTLGWYFPNRDHFGPIYGNYYATLFEDACDAAWGRIPPLTRSFELANVVNDIWGWQGVFFESDLPDWLADQLVNSLSHIRSGMWFRTCPNCVTTKDLRADKGFWRQWEAYDCSDLDSVHNDGERHIPYIMFFPESERNKMAAWAHNQGGNGMLAEQIHNSDPDAPEGRIMADVSSMFIVEVLEMYRWAGDNITLNLYYPVVKRAAQWQMSVSTTYGVPVGLETTYDILGFPQYTLSAYASVYHLCALRAAAVLATAMGDTAFATLCTQKADAAQIALDLYQYNKTGNYYFAASSGCTVGVGCSTQMGVFADTFYSQVLAFSVGLGVLVSDASKIVGHLTKQLETNCFQVLDGVVVPGCPNGLNTLTGRPPQVTDWQLWEMASPDHTTLSLRLGLNTSAAMAVFEGAATSWSQRQNDQWNTAGIKDTAGQPTVTSHYGYHMPSWHILLALSGQLADLSNPAKSWLSFNPVAEYNTDSFIFPVVLPGVVGQISSDPSGQYIFGLTVGSLSVQNLSVNGVAYPGPVSLSAGEIVVWSRS